MALEKELVTRARQGDRAALEELCRATWEPLYRFLYYLVQNRYEAEELTQETYLRALPMLDTLRAQDGAGFVGYLRQVARNLVRDRWRQRSRNTCLPDVDLACLGSADVGEDPAAAAEAREEEERVRTALASLAPDYRRVITLRLLDGWSVRQTAHAMGRSEGAVRVLQYRALVALRKALYPEKPSKGEGDLP